MTDAIFSDGRLAEIYDPLDHDRSDLDLYLSLVEEVRAHTIIDIGCGTGTFACLLATRGYSVVAVDPARASIDVARRKPGAERVRWVVGGVTDLPDTQADAVTMTGNVAQVFLSDAEWSTVLDGARRALRPGGHLMFEVRDPADEAWRRWTRELSHRRVTIPDVGPVRTWVDVTRVDLPLVSFRWTFEFERDASVLTSDSTLRFRDRPEVERSLAEAGFVVEDVRDAPDRPGRELVFIAQRREVES
ncbi:MAG TPA: class I SAM-dependent methyltransferase [Actinomycetota bacterium]|nr:class I SAM-dependent methyltransferase [Actinomycetota bacterium]